MDYYIGDVQGCFDELMDLVAKLQFDPARDHLYFCGDLVNRGPASLAVLQWLEVHRQAVDLVLGNHDIYLLARLWSLIPAKDSDTMEDVYADPAAIQWTEWLRQKPLLLKTSHGYMVHAGIHPTWSLQEAQTFADRISGILKSEQGPAFLKQYFSKAEVYANQADDASSWDQLCFALRVLITIRSVDASGQMSRYAGQLKDLPHGQQAWFHHPVKGLDKDQQLYCGHWAAVGYTTLHNSIHLLDSGCIWGHTLSAYAPQIGQLIQVPARRKL